MIIKKMHLDDISDLYNGQVSFKTDIAPILIDEQEIIYYIPFKIDDGFINGVY